ESYAVQGEWAAAIRHRLRAVARQLEETGILNPAPGRTANAPDAYFSDSDSTMQQPLRFVQGRAGGCCG
ncbi:MAG: hypothetical protein ACXWCS_22085, partial [Burkholderiales bacterium]